MKNPKTIYHSFIQAPNKLYFFLSHKRFLLLLFVGLALLFGMIGYMVSPKVNGFDVFNRTVGLFAFAWIDEVNGYLVIAEFFAILSVFLGVIILFLSDVVNRWMLVTVQNKPYTLLVGLGVQNSSFLRKKSLEHSSTIIIESDKNNIYIEQFKQKGFALVLKKAEEALQTLNLKNLKQTIISTGEDRQNISIAIHIIENLPQDTHTKLFIRIEDRVLGILFKQNVIKKYKKNIDVLIYSMYENITRELFEKHSILGLQRDIIETDDDFHVVLVGESPLTTEIFYELIILSNLPEQNRLNIHLVAKDAKAYLERLRKLFSNIQNISHLHINPISLDSDDAEFYKHTLWRNHNLTNIIIATDDENKNLNIAITLQDQTYIEDIAKKEFKSKVHFAIYSNLRLSKEIDTNNEAFANFFTFANIDQALSAENIINEDLDNIAKSINYLYKETDYNPNLLFDKEQQNDIERRWLDIEKYSDKISTKMQAIHINVKLLALGLNKQKSDKPKKELLEINKEIFFKKLGKLPITLKQIEDFSKEYKNNNSDIKPLNLPKTYTSLFEKLIRAEHNRWNTYHYLNGWRYAPVKNKTTKEHNCLLPFDQIDHTIIHDIYAVIYIPNILASVGYCLYTNDTPSNATPS